MTKYPSSATAMIKKDFRCQLISDEEGFLKMSPLGDMQANSILEQHCSRDHSYMAPI